MNHLEQLLLEEFQIFVSSVAAANEDFEITVFGISEFMRCKVTQKRLFPGVTIRIYFR